MKLHGSEFDNHIKDTEKKFKSNLDGLTSSIKKSKSFEEQFTMILATIGAIPGNIKGILVLLILFLILGIWQLVESLIYLTIITNGWLWVGVAGLIIAIIIKKNLLLIYIIWKKSKESINNTIGSWSYQLRVWWHKTKTTILTYISKRK